MLPGPNGQGGEEGTHLDFKREHHHGPRGHRDTALDLAAFANALGGVLVFGVAEDGQRPKFAGSLHPIDVEATVRHVEDAITTWTYGFEERPRPEPMDVAGHRVVIVNVPPSARLVSVRGHNDPSIAYPFRHEHGNHYLKAEEVAHRLDTRRGFAARNKLATWLRSSNENGCLIYLFYLQPSTGELPIVAQWKEDTAGGVQLMDVTPHGARLSFWSASLGVKIAFEIPYEWIISVWWNGDRVAVHVAANIFLHGMFIRAVPMRW